MADHLHGLISSLPPCDQAQVAQIMAAVMTPGGLRFELEVDGA
jgi:hypothetical protein